MKAVIRYIPVEVLNPVKRFFKRSISHPIDVTLQIQLVLRIMVRGLIPSIRQPLVSEKSAYREPTSPHLIHFLILDIVG